MSELPNPHGGLIGRERIADLCVFETHTEAQAVLRYLKHIWPSGDYPAWVPTPISRQGAPGTAWEAPAPVPQPVALPAAANLGGAYSHHDYLRGEGYNAALADVQQALRGAGIPFKETP